MFQAVLALLNSHLSLVIGDRNKTAHAQWVWFLNSKETGFVGAANDLLSGTIVILDVDRGSPPAEVDQGGDIVAWAQ
jgi:hypothetical protein